MNAVEEKTCSKCGETKARSEFHRDKCQKDGLYSQCKECKNAATKEAYHDNLEDSRHKCRKRAERKRAKDPEGNRLRKREWLKRQSRFKISLTYSRFDAERRNHTPCSATVGELESSFTGKCAVCGVPEAELNTSLQMDYDHETGKFRGWLCGKCNKAAGLLNDDERVVNALLCYLLSRKE